MLRTEQGISQRTLGELVGVSQQSINKYENYNIEPDISTLTKLANYFETTIDYLVGRTGIRSNLEISASHSLTPDEVEILSEYRLLSEPDKAILLSLLVKYNE